MSESNMPPTDGVAIEELQSSLEQTEIRFALLFGSHARDEADSTSDVDVALAFPETMTDDRRFRLRNQIDAELQQYADGFVDVNDIEALPTPVARAALRDGIVLTGNNETVERYRATVEERYEETASQRERERREFIDRLARGDV